MSCIIQSIIKLGFISPPLSSRLVNTTNFHPGVQWVRECSNEWVWWGQWTGADIGAETRHWPSVFRPWSRRADNTNIMSMSALGEQRGINGGDFYSEYLFSYLDSLVDLLRDESVQEKMDEVGRLFFSNDSVTINLYWAAAAALLTLLRKKYF